MIGQGATVIYRIRDAAGMQRDVTITSCGAGTAM
jgi:hypothetical protein